MRLRMLSRVAAFQGKSRVTFMAAKPLKNKRPLRIRNARPHNWLKSNPKANKTIKSVLVAKGEDAS